MCFFKKNRVNGKTKMFHKVESCRDVILYFIWYESMKKVIYIVKVICDVYPIFYSSGDYSECRYMKDLNHHSRVRVIQGCDEKGMYNVVANVRMTTRNDN